MSTVYDDIASRLDAEATQINGEAEAAQASHDAVVDAARDQRDQAVAALDATRDDALRAADAVLQSAIVPLKARAREVDAIRSSIFALQQQASVPVDPAEPQVPVDPAEPQVAVDPSDPQIAADPQMPSAPESSADDTSDSSPAPSGPEVPAPGSSQPTSEPEPSTPQDEPSTSPSEPEQTPSTPSSDASPAPLPTASPDEALDLALARGIDATQPIAVPLTTGQIAVVTAADIAAAHNPDTDDDALTTAALNLRRNSDWP